MRVILFLVCLVGVGQSATLAPPAKCCTDREFQVTLGEAGGAMYKINGHYVQNFLQGYNNLYYDSYNEMVAVESVIISNGTVTSTNILFDYPKKFQYVTPKGGSCTRYALGQATFRKPCIPDESEFDGYSYMGYGAEQLPLVSWRYRQPGTDHIVKLSVTKEGCIPVIENIFGHFKTNISDSVAANTMFLMAKFQPSISNRDLFKIPSGCSSSTGTIPQPVGRSLRGIHALFAN
ncbi:uncharacterized protein LOC124133811 [Haliotis rufescens]|uniref:uncharacterized protein LOC124133811 n=1 Tax=Haliotis rufescens TaxID=6454 RepID=UPI00201E81B8|nr:uncharacterized protein LOC124133811 [Haliotis rufescens]